MRGDIVVVSHVLSTIAPKKIEEARVDLTILDGESDVREGLPDAPEPRHSVREAHFACTSEQTSRRLIQSGPV